MVIDLTKMDVANGSLLDEGTAAAEAMLLAYNATSRQNTRFIVDKNTHPQTIACLKTRAEPFGIEIILFDCVRDHKKLPPTFGAHVQVKTRDVIVYRRDLKISKRV